MASCTLDSFYNDSCRAAFSRIKSVCNASGHIPSWEEIITDPVIKEKYRDELETAECKVVKEKSQVDGMVRHLEKYRKARALYFDAEATLEQLQGDDLDVDSLLEEKSKNLLKLHTSSASVEDRLIHIGRGNNSVNVVKEVLYGEKAAVVPTGFKAWDDVNGGIPYGALMTMAGTTGGGKCLDGSHKVLTSEGEKALIDLWNSVDGEPDANGFKPLDVMVYTHEGPKKTSHVYKTRGKCVSVKLSSGKVLKGLPEHRIWVIEAEGSTVFRRLDQLQPGDSVPEYDNEELSTQFPKDET